MERVSCSQRKFPGSYSVWREVADRKVQIWTSDPRIEAEEHKLATDIASRARGRKEDMQARRRGKYVIKTPNPLDIGRTLDPPTAPPTQEKVYKFLKVEKEPPISNRSPSQFQIRGSSKIEPPKLHTALPGPTLIAPSGPSNVNLMRTAPMKNRQPPSAPQLQTTLPDSTPLITPLGPPKVDLKPSSPVKNRPPSSAPKLVPLLVPGEGTKSSPQSCGHHSLQNGNEANDQENFPFTFLGQLKKENALLKTDLAFSKQEIDSLKRKRQEDTDDRPVAKRQEQAFEREDVHPGKQKEDILESHNRSPAVAQISALQQEIVLLKRRNKEDAESNARLLDRHKEIQRKMQSVAKEHLNKISVLASEIDNLKKARRVDTVPKESGLERIELVKRHVCAFVSKYGLDTLDSPRMAKGFTQEHIQWFLGLKGLVEGASIILAEEKTATDLTPVPPQETLHTQSELDKGSFNHRQNLAEQDNAPSHTDTVSQTRIVSDPRYTAVCKENATLRREVEALEKKAVGVQIFVKQLQELRVKSVDKISTLVREKEELKIKCSERRIGLEGQVETKAKFSKMSEQIKTLEEQLHTLREILKLSKAELDEQILTKMEILVRNKNLEKEFAMFKTTSATTVYNLRKEIEKMAEEIKFKQEEFTTLKNTSFNKTLASEKQLEDLWATHNSTKFALENRIVELLNSASEAKSALEAEKDRKSTDLELRSTEISLVVRRELDSSLASFQQNERALTQRNKTYRELVGVLQEHQAKLKLEVVELQGRLNSIREAIKGTSCDETTGTSSLREFETREAKLIEELAAI